MVNISRQFAPPFKLIAPFFILGGIFLFVSTLFLWKLSPSSSIADMEVLSWVHLYLLGFVMMIIFGAMAQLIPVVFEVGHFSVDFYYIIWPTLAIGTLLMAYGFLNDTVYIAFGGFLVLLSMSIFVADTLLTLKYVKSYNTVIVSVVLASLFLLLGVGIGFAMGLGFAGLFAIDIIAWLSAHVYAVIGGFVFLSIMAYSFVLIPMFGLSHNFNKFPLKLAVTILSIGVSIVILNSFVDLEYLNTKVGYALSIVSVLIYMYQVYSIFITRARKEIDIYMKAILFSFSSLLFCVLFYVFYLYTGNEIFILLTGWLLFMGFFAVLIIGHLYKIIPFLVWYERFSPLVGKEKVPMLHEMLPKSASLQLFITCIGIFITALGIGLKYIIIYKLGLLLLLIGSLMVLLHIISIIRYK